MGNVAVTIKRRSVRGNKRIVYADVSLSASYATGGDTVQAADITNLCGVGGLGAVDLFAAERTSTGESLYLDRTAKKLKAFGTAGEIANTTDLSGKTWRIALEHGDDPAGNV